MSVKFSSLGDLCDRKIRRIDPSLKPEKLFDYIDISSIDNSKKKITTPNKVLGQDASVRARQVVRTGDILVAMTRPNLNAVAIVPQKFDGQICSTGFCILRPLSNACTDYIFGFVRSKKFVETLTALVQGALYPAVTSEQVFAQKIPNLTLKEQQVKGETLRNQMKHLRCASDAGEEQISELYNLQNAIIRKSLTGNKVLSIRLGEALNEIRSGIGEDWQEYRVLGATRSGLAPAREQPGKNPQRYKPVTPGTVFYNPMRIMIGSIAFMDTGEEPGITSPDYVVLRGKEGVVDSRWFYYWLRSPYGERCIQSLARGAVRERMLFNRLAEGEIELPDYETQLKASAALAEIKPMQDAVEAQLKELELIPQKLLAQIFES